MKIKDLVLAAIESGAAERDENDNVTFQLFDMTHSVRVTDEEIKAYQRSVKKRLEQAEIDYADAEAAMAAAKAVIQKHKKRKK